ncbi:hypothetical protein AYO21_03423 [Fonsecaea monophora]|uniref:PUA domain-containing protein n=1 Tax=Fonsecaea monophora TaxID=254056 RepID=A0A177FDB4_9EURO|nr:hypothetical protein AYO21_03423 [Fonsecaea monophora]KAH0843132.1 Translation machinery-associated protein [Fonsecaea pedrosoi]OAG42255.1 hypothetical protein AYO21_03423 [Fonsecaea monophora]
MSSFSQPVAEEERNLEMLSFPPPHGKSLTKTCFLSPDRVSLYVLDDRPLFYQHMDDPIIPHLKLVHQYPQCFKHLRIDRGAIRFVLSGATLMVPGLTSAGGWLPDKDEEVKAGEVVAITAEGKEEVCMIGILEVGTEEMKAKKKGVAMSSGHYLGDGLWKMELS